MIYATVSDGINSYLADFKTWSLATLGIVAVILVIWGFISKFTLAKILMLGLTIVIGFVIATAPGDIAIQAKQDWDKRSNSMPVIERPAPPTAVEVV